MALYGEKKYGEFQLGRFREIGNGTVNSVALDKRLIKKSIDNNIVLLFCSKFKKQIKRTFHIKKVKVSTLIDKLTKKKAGLHFIGISSTLRSLKVYIRKVGNGFVDSFVTVKKSTKKNTGKSIVKIIVIKQRIINKNIGNRFVSAITTLTKNSTKTIKNKTISIISTTTKKMQAIRAVGSNLIIAKGSILKQKIQFVGNKMVVSTVAIKKRLQAIRATGQGKINSFGNALKYKFQAVGDGFVRSIGDAYKAMQMKIKKGLVVVCASAKKRIPMNVGFNKISITSTLSSMRVLVRKVGNSVVVGTGNVSRGFVKIVGTGIISISLQIKKAVNKNVGISSLSKAVYGIFKYGEKRYGGSQPPIQHKVRMFADTKKFTDKTLAQDLISPFGNAFKTLPRFIGFGIINMGTATAKKVNKLIRKCCIVLSSNISKSISLHLISTVNSVGDICKNTPLYFEGIVISTGNAFKTINKKFYSFINIKSLISKSISLHLVSVMNSFGDVRKSIAIHFESIVVSIGNTIKTATKRLYSFINIKGAVSKMTSKFTGKGNVSMEGVLYKMKSYFIVKENGELYPLDVLVLRDTREELIAGTRDNVDEIPGLHGEYDFGTELRGRSLELKCVTRNGLSFGEKMKLRRKIAEKLNPMKGYRVLIFEDDSDIEYKVKYSGKIDIKNYPKFFEFTIPFKMEKPFLYDREENSIIGNGVIENIGSIETGLVIEIKGSANNPSLTIGNKTLKYTGTIPTNKTLIINTLFRTAKIGNENVLDNYNGVFPLIETGETEVVAGNNVTVRWINRYL